MAPDDAACKVVTDRSAAHVQAFTAQLVDVEGSHVEILRGALADAGCLDIDASAEVGDIVLRGPDELHRRLIVVGVCRGNIANLQRLSGAVATPILAICDEEDMELVFSAGATQVAVRPLRRREVLSRIREAMRGHAPGEPRAGRERAMSDAIVALQKEKQDLERLVCVDTLTGVANRRHAMELLALEWKRATREQTSLAIIMIDLDCFHAYNERYGHLGGDTCLQRVADVMVRCLRRPSDFLGRYGGEEFVAVLPSTDAAGAKIVAERLRAAVEELRIRHEGSVCSDVVTITVGFAAVQVLPNDTVETAIAAADRALLEAKSYGRNRIGGDAPLSRPSRESAQAWERYAPVYIDPCFAPRVPAFLATVKQQLAELTASMRHGERRSGLAMRRLCNTAQELGLVGVKMLIHDVEEALREGELSSLRTAAEELLHYVTHVQVVYRRPDEVRTTVA